MILVFDTSTSHLSIGLATDLGEVLSEYHAEATPNERGIHDARLARETDNLLREAGAKAREISRIGLIIGPGSFTGLRIGLSFAKGLAFATGAGIVALSQHEVLQASYDGDAEYIITPGYRAEQIYFAEASAPRDIRLISMEEFELLPSRPTIIHPLLEATFGPLRPFMSLEPALTTMAKQTATSKEAIHGEALDSLEPLYITEFKPGG